jgi:uncharacterized protein YuzE
VATEATLSKVADGLGNLANNAAAMGGNGTGETYVNIQTGNPDASTPAAPNSGNSLKIASSTYPETYPETNTATSTKLEIDIKAPEEIQQVAPTYLNTPMPSASPNASNTLWQLEQLDILSLSKDLFYQPEWNRLSTEEYTQISTLFRTLFNKKVPTKESLPFLAQFPVKIPVPEIAQLELSGASNLEAQDVELICKAFEMIKVTNLFEYFILEMVGPNIVIRPKLPKEKIIFGGEEELLLAHCHTFYKNELIASPSIDCLKSIIKLKDQFLVDYLIQKVDIKNEAEFISISEALISKHDDTKKKLFNKFKKIKYNTQTDAGYIYLKTLTKLGATFADQTIAQELIKSIIEIQVDDNLTITNVDVINSYTDVIYFGPKNEYRWKGDCL